MYMVTLKYILFLWIILYSLSVVAIDCENQPSTMRAKCELVQQFTELLKIRLIYIKSIEKGEKQFCDLDKQLRQNDNQIKNVVQAIEPIYCNDKGCKSIQDEYKKLKQFKALFNQEIDKLRTTCLAPIPPNDCSAKIESCEGKLSKTEQQIVAQSKKIESLQAQLASKEETFTAVTEIAKYTQQQLNACKAKLAQSCQPKSDVVDQNKHIKALREKIADYKNEKAELKSELNEARNIIISLIIQNLLAQNTCDNISISIDNGNMSISGVSGSSERIAELKKRAQEQPYFSLTSFDVSYIDTNSCMIRITNKWAIIAQEDETIEELSYNDGVSKYRNKLPHSNNCSNIGEILQDSEKVSNQFFTSGIEPQIWASNKGVVGICRGVEDDDGFYEWSFKRGHYGYSALLIINVQQ